MDYFQLEEFYGCCAFAIIIDFPMRHSKTRTNQLLDTMREAVHGGFGPVGGIWCTLNNGQTSQWHSTLLTIGFVCLSENVNNPNTGNKINTYFFDTQAVVTGDDDDPRLSFREIPKSL